MKGVMTMNFVQWLQGKKTYIGAAIMVLAAVVGWWFHLVSDPELVSICAAAFAMCGLGARSTRYGELTLQALERVQMRASAEGASGSRKIGG
jgi:hypothetical protein